MHLVLDLTKTKTMKTFVLSLFIGLLCISVKAQTATTNELLGQWQLDMSPEDTTDNRFAMMRIDKIENSSFTGTFYREGVAIENGQLNTQSLTIYGALISRDNSGSYNSTFFLKDGKLYGSTHAIDRGFLAVWTGTKKE